MSEAEAKLTKRFGKNRRCCMRLPSEQRKKIDELVHEGKFKNLSEVIRTALEQFLKNEALE